MKDGMLKNVPSFAFRKSVKNMETKKEIRKRILALRDGLTSSEKDNKSRMITEKIINIKEYQDTDSVLIFVSYRSEVDTGYIINDCFINHKKVYVPKVNGNNMEFYRIYSVNDLEEGYKGIREPASLKEPFYDNKECTAVMIMPGAVFDKSGNRIGYGGGFYDKYLADSFHGKKVAVCYDIQIVEEGCFITESTDIKPDMVVTESGIFKAII